MRILVIEDELQLARHITTALMRHGHLASAQHDGAEGLRVALSDPPDLVVLDLSLPSLDGLAVLAQLRKAGSPARVLVLTARGEVGDRVKGLKAGADDYLAKPFSMDELVARIDALGRRGGNPTATDLLKVADLHMDVQHRRVVRGGQTVALSPREFDVLRCSCRSPAASFRAPNSASASGSAITDTTRAPSKFSSRGCAKKWTPRSPSRSSTRCARSATPSARRFSPPLFL